MAAYNKFNSFVEAPAPFVGISKQLTAELEKVKTLDQAKSVIARYASLLGQAAFELQYPERAAERAARDAAVAEENALGRVQ